MATSTTGLMTTEQFLALPDQYDASGNLIKAELVAGEIVPMANASRVHDVTKNQINELLILFLATRQALALKSLVELGFDVTEHDALKPDVSVISRSRLSATGSRVLTGAPEIAIEVVSPSDTAVHLKHRIGVYLANGSRSAWIVYPEERAIEVHTSAGMRSFSGSQVLEDASLPGFSHPASAFFQEI